MTEEDVKQLESPKKNRLRLSFAGVIAGIALVLGGVVFWSLSMRIPTPAATAIRQADEKASVLDVRFDNLEKSVALYETRISKLEGELESLRTAAAPASAEQPGTATLTENPTGGEVPPDVAKRMETLEKDLAALKAAAPMQSAEHISDSIKLLSAYHRLSERVLSGKPYAEMLSTFEEAMGDDTSQAKALAQLSAFSENGVPQLAELLASFDEAADQLNAAQAVPPADAGAWDRFVYNITHLVRVRRIDEAQTGKDVDSVVGRAAAHLDKGEIEAAYAEINALPESARAQFSNWLEGAQIAIDAPGMLNQIEEEVMQKVFKPSGALPAPSEPSSSQPVSDNGASAS